MNSLKTIAAMSQKLEQIKDSRSEFIEQLKERGLNEEEIRFCCLEVLGVKG